MPTIGNQDLFDFTFNNMDSVRKLDMSILKRHENRCHSL